MNSPWRVQFSGEIKIFPPESVTVRGVITFTTMKGSTMGEITVKDDEATLRAAVTFTDAEGNFTAPDQVPVWEVGDDSVLVCTPADDGLSATFEVGAPGVCSVTVRTVETHGGEGDPTDVVLSGLVTVVAGDTVTGSVDFSTG